MSGVVVKLWIVLESLVIVVGCEPLVTLESTAATTTATTASIPVLLTAVILLITRLLRLVVVLPLFSRLSLTHGIRDVLLGIEIWSAAVVAASVLAVLRLRGTLEILLLADWLDVGISSWLVLVVQRVIVSLWLYSVLAKFLVNIFRSLNALSLKIGA